MKMSKKQLIELVQEQTKQIEETNKKINGIVNSISEVLDEFLEKSKVTLIQRRHGGISFDPLSSRITYDDSERIMRVFGYWRNREVIYPENLINNKVYFELKQLTNNFSIKTKYFAATDKDLQNLGLVLDERNFVYSKKEADDTLSKTINKNKGKETLGSLESNALKLGEKELVDILRELKVII